MRNALLLLIVAALPAAAQFEGGSAEELAESARKAAAMREKLRPASVDKGRVEALFSKLSNEGQQVEMKYGIDHVLARLGHPDAEGRVRNLQATLIELSPEAVEEPSDSMVRHAVMRRYFSHLEAQNEIWNVDPATNSGRVDVWRWTVGLDGSLLSVTHQIIPIERDATGLGAPVDAKARAYRMSPSDPSVQKRWKSVSKDLLTLGRLTEV